MEDRMGIAAAEQIARLLAQVEPLSRDNERLAAAPIKGSFATPSLIAYVLNGKHVNALPLYRMEYDLKCLGAPISRQNMAN